MNDDDFLKNKFSGFGFGNFGSHGPFGQNQNPNDFFEAFFHQDFEHMFREMEKMMRDFPLGNIDFIQNPHFEIPEEENASNSITKKPENLRNHFLKSPEENQNTSELVSKPSLERGSLFNQFFFTRPQFITDSIEPSDRSKDLEKYFKRDIIEKDNDKNNLKPEFNRPFIKSTSQSCSIRKIQRPDGSIEEVKTIRNSDGHEETTVTRIIGDKAHSLIEKKTKKGVEETEEVFQNFDENDLSDFNKMWKNFPQHNKKESASDPIIKTDSQTQSSSLISKLFSWFK
ncbi:unnamed protein product [Brachionus calyciflorus]|uniref:Uncharacterized protein n=1 Tax=Brachionus calyciflorus TaxID=104777 RepID=A0A813PEN5_9BILA|nr:unnamed protein product [Brachionus calyciflorus]